MNQFEAKMEQLETEKEKILSFLRKQRLWIKENEHKTEKTSLSKEREAEKKRIANMDLSKDKRTFKWNQRSLGISE